MPSFLPDTSYSNAGALLDPAMPFPTNATGPDIGGTLGFPNPSVLDQLGGIGSAYLKMQNPVLAGMDIPGWQKALLHFATQPMGISRGGKYFGTAGMPQAGTNLMMSKMLDQWNQQKSSPGPASTPAAIKNDVTTSPTSEPRTAENESPMRLPMGGWTPGRTPGWYSTVNPREEAAMGR